MMIAQQYDSNVDEFYKYAHDPFGIHLGRFKGKSIDPIHLSNRTHR